MQHGLWKKERGDQSPHSKGAGFRWFALVLGIAASTPVQGGEKVAIRVADGRFLRAVAEGAVRPEGVLPAREHLFQLDARDGGTIALKAPNGRFVVAEDREARRVRADSPRAEPGERETFQIVAVEGNRVALKAKGFRNFVTFSTARAGAAGPAPGGKPRPEEIVEIFRVSEIPASICGLFSKALQGIAAEELKGKTYDKVRSHKVEKFADLPAPTLRDLARTKRRRVLSMIEECHVKAELDGKPEIEIMRMPSLKGYRDPATSLLMFQVKASIPIKGRVGYKIPKAVSVSAGFRAVARLAMTGEIRVEKSGDTLSLRSPELREIHVDLHDLKISNNLLNAAREPLEDLVNHELRRNEDRIRQQANKALAKAVKAREFHHPLLRFLSTIMPGSPDPYVFYVPGLQATVLDRKP